MHRRRDTTSVKMATESSKSSSKSKFNTRTFLKSIPVPMPLIIVTTALVISLNLLIFVTLPTQATPAHINMSPPPNQQQQQQQQQLIPNQNSILNNPYTTATHELLLKLRGDIIDRAMKFDLHFRSLLTSSKLNLHKMFVDTYGMMYEQNMEIFTSMYESLEQYYATGQIKLTKSMEHFFERLYVKIFQVYNQHLKFDEAYMNCTGDQLTSLKPFKDAPDKLNEEIRHAFVAARTFNQALNSGLDVIKGIISLGQPTQCINLLNEKLLKHTWLATQQQSQFGQSAQSSRLPPPCPLYCEQVILRCIGRANLEPLNTKWNNYVLSLAELAKKLSIHYNIETIIAPLDVQISEAIMNFQENAPNITQSVFQACGRPSAIGSSNMNQMFSSGGDQHHHFGGGSDHSTSAATLNSMKQHQSNRLGKRAALASPMMSLVSQGRGGLSTRTRNQMTAGPHVQTMPSANGRHPASGFNNDHLESNYMDLNQQQLMRASNFGGGRHQSSALDPSLLAMQPIGKKSPIVIDEIKDFMLSTRNFWSQLPNAVCSSNYTLGGSAHLAMDSASRNKQQQQGNCYSEQLGLSDMNTDLKYRAEIQQLIQRLEFIQSRTASALKGIEVDWSAAGPSLNSGAPQSTMNNNNNNLPTPNGSMNSGGGRISPIIIAPPTSTTTTSTTTPEPDDTEPGEDEEPIESGSGQSPDGYDQTDDSEEDPSLSTTEGPEPGDEEDPIEPSTDKQPDLSSAEQPPDVVNQVDPMMIDRSKPAINNDISNSITPPDARTSSAAVASSIRSLVILQNLEATMMMFQSSLLGLLVVTVAMLSRQNQFNLVVRNLGNTLEDYR